MTDKQTKHILLESFIWLMVGMEVAFALAGPLSIYVTYRDGKIFDAGMLLIGWFLVLAHLLLARRRSSR